jgi:hypothetical protein
MGGLTGKNQGRTVRPSAVVDGRDYYEREQADGKRRLGRCDA